MGFADFLGFLGLKTIECEKMEVMKNMFDLLIHENILLFTEIDSSDDFSLHEVQIRRQRKIILYLRNRHLNPILQMLIILYLR